MKDVLLNARRFAKKIFN